jgi:hypothetical protein
MLAAQSFNFTPYASVSEDGPWHGAGLQTKKQGMPARTHPPHKRPTGYRELAMDNVGWGGASTHVPTARIILIAGSYNLSSMLCFKGSLEIIPRAPEPALPPFESCPRLHGLKSDSSLSILASAVLTVLDHQEHEDRSCPPVARQNSRPRVVLVDRKSTRPSPATPGIHTSFGVLSLL